MGGGSAIRPFPASRRLWLVWADLTDDSVSELFAWSSPHTPSSRIFHSNDPLDIPLQCARITPTGSIEVVFSVFFFVLNKLAHPQTAVSPTEPFGSPAGSLPSGQTPLRAADPVRGPLPMLRIHPHPPTWILLIFVHRRCEEFARFLTQMVKKLKIHHPGVFDPFDRLIVCIVTEPSPSHPDPDSAREGTTPPPPQHGARAVCRQAAA